MASVAEGPARLAANDVAVALADLHDDPGRVVADESVAGRVVEDEGPLGVEGLEVPAEIGPLFRGLSFGLRSVGRKGEQQQDDPRHHDSSLPSSGRQ